MIRLPCDLNDVEFALKSRNFCNSIFQTQSALFLTYRTHFTWLCVVYFLLLKLKSSLKERTFHTILETKENSEADLRAISKSACKECFQKCKSRWQRCIAITGEYFKRDRFNLEYFF
ncbi:hypothetical protein WH47_12617 [Habropoda laboriosa]|uniref:Uncharacterized protein n=1 Tax=Habropoda laboriosa TaxID=597456 RepID=A0A0L7R7F4_9HYME|nr:hypothetical protein WH47_12617 [Habropoda laboriosa]